MNWLSSGPFTVFDLETTGFSAVRDRIIEIGAVRVELDGSVSRFQTLVNPGVPIPPRLTALTGIDDAMVADAPKFKEAGFKFMDFARKSRLVAHNARFDLSFMQESLARCGMELIQGGAYDSIPIFRRAYPGLSSYSIEFLRSKFPVPDNFPGQPHRAAYDADVTFSLFTMAMNILCGDPRHAESAGN
ncbi:MAG: 3'-5' exonuclease [Lentisphaeria bacterium]|nr:3'-5' exonuclease [Lentisphaeria bacterium]